MENNRLNNLIIIIRLLEYACKDSSGTHLDYYNEKCERYLGLIPNPEIFFKLDGLNQRSFIKILFIRKAGDILDTFLQNDLFTRISDKCNITTDTKYEWETRYNIHGLNPVLGNRVMEDIKSVYVNKRIMRSVKLCLLLE